MDALQGLLPESWLIYVTAAVAICAAITTILPAPSEGSGKVYRTLYTVLQWIALNLGKARNAQDTPQAAQPAQNLK